MMKMMMITLYVDNDDNVNNLNDYHLNENENNYQDNNVNQNDERFFENYLGFNFRDYILINFLVELNNSLVFLF